jgi:L-fuconolactonase
LEIEKFVPYLYLVAEVFGINRLMYGSDWPVCLLGGSYGEVTRIVKQFFSEAEQLAMGENGKLFYGI